MKVNGRRNVNDLAGGVDEEWRGDLSVVELREIKRLLVLLLRKMGATQDELARAFKKNQSNVSRQYSMGDAKPAAVAVLREDEED